jgi:hypothetical protein
MTPVAGSTPFDPVAGVGVVDGVGAAVVVAVVVDGFIVGCADVGGELDDVADAGDAPDFSQPPTMAKSGVERRKRVALTPRAPARPVVAEFPVLVLMALPFRIPIRLFRFLIHKPQIRAASQ